MVTVSPLTVQTEEGLLVANTMGTPDGAPDALSVIGPLPTFAVAGGLNPTMTAPAGLMTILAVTCGAAA